MTAERHPVLDLPFVADRKRSEPGWPRCFWNIDQADDTTGLTGEHYALAYLRWLRDHPDDGRPGFLPSIVADMPRDITGIEIGFLVIIDHAAQRGGLAAAERLVAYWESWRQNEASKKARRPRRPRRPKLTLVANNGDAEAQS